MSEYTDTVFKEGMGNGSRSHILNDIPVFIPSTTTSTLDLSLESTIRAPAHARS